MTEGANSTSRIVRSAAPAEDSTRPAIDALTGIRILAAAWVVVYHLREGGLLPNLMPATERAAWLTQGGYLGVDLFFTLSGFIISYNYLDRFGHFSWQSYRRFLYLRLARIYPLHLATLLAVLVILAGARIANAKVNSPGIYSPTSFVTNIFLVHAWGFSGHGSWNYPSWSISAEWFAYLTFPVLVALVFAKVGVSSPRRSLLGVILALVLGGSLLEIWPSASWGDLVRITTEFSAGCFLYALHAQTQGRPLHDWLLPLSFALALSAVFVSHSRIVAVAPALAFIVWATARGRGPMANWLASRTMVFWGQASYSVYMTHAIVIIILNKAINPEHWLHSPLAVRSGVVAVYILVIAATAAGSFLLVEKPSREWLRARLPSKRKCEERSASAGVDRSCP